MTYLEKLKDPRWQKKRLEVLQRDDWTCRNCGEKTKTLHIHHWWYAKNKDPWEYDLEDLSTLCEECHEAETVERVSIEEAFLDCLKENHFSCDDIINLANLIYSKTITREELIERRQKYWELFKCRESE